MATDFWGVVVPNWIGALGGFIGAGVAIVSLVVALRARSTATQAVVNDAETRDAVAIIAKPVEASSTIEGSGSIHAEGVVGPPPGRSPEDQAKLDQMIRRWAKVARGSVDDGRFRI